MFYRHFKLLFKTVNFLQKLGFDFLIGFLYDFPIIAIRFHKFTDFLLLSSLITLPCLCQFHL